MFLSPGYVKQNGSLHLNLDEQLNPGIVSNASEVISIPATREDIV